MANVTQILNSQGRTGRRFKCTGAFMLEDGGVVIAEYVPGLTYHETEANKATVKQNEDKVQWL